MGQRLPWWGKSCHRLAPTEDSHLCKTVDASSSLFQRVSYCISYKCLLIPFLSLNLSAPRIIMALPGAVQYWWGNYTPHRQTNQLTFLIFRHEFGHYLRQFLWRACKHSPGHGQTLLWLGGSSAWAEWIDQNTASTSCCHHKLGHGSALCSEFAAKPAMALELMGIQV